jgi:hypothetical protein
MHEGNVHQRSPCHLDSYLDEEVFRFNERKTRDADPFKTIVFQVSGKRIQYRELISRGWA